MITLSKGLLLPALCVVSCYAQELSALSGQETDTSFNQKAILTAQSRSASAGKGDRSVVVIPGDTIIPHVVDGGSWRTSFTFVNLENRVVRFQLLFLSDDARDLYLSIGGLGATRGVQVTLQPTATLSFESSGVGSLSSGWAYMLPDNPTDAIGGQAVFRQSVFGRPDFEAVVPIVSKFDGHFALLFDNVGFTTAAALSNTTSVGISIPVIVRSETGAVLERQTLFLPAYSHIAVTAPDRFPSTAGRRGSIEFMASQPGIGALGLRFGAVSFTSFQVLTNAAWR